MAWQGIWIGTAQGTRLPCACPCARCVSVYTAIMQERRPRQNINDNTNCLRVCLYRFAREYSSLYSCKKRGMEPYMHVKSEVWSLQQWSTCMCVFVCVCVCDTICACVYNTWTCTTWRAYVCVRPRTCRCHDSSPTCSTTRRFLLQLRR